MTRINSNIPPEELHTVHLLAEHREILRVFEVAYKAKIRGHTPLTYEISEKFCLGAGHVKFFTSRLLFIFKRYFRLYDECKKRNLNVTNLFVGKKSLNDDAWYNNWESTEQEDDLVRERILERVAENRKKYNFPDDVELNQETWADHVKKDREQRIRGKM